jgi:acyl carrier protein
MPSAAAIDPQLGFTDLGMDSLMAVELSNRLRTSLDCPVSAAIAFDYPTIEALADYFDETIAKQLANAATTAVSPTVSAGATAPLPTRPSPTALSGNRIPDYKFPDASPNPQRVKPQRPGVHPLVSPPPISRMALAELSESEAEALLISQLEAMRY